MAKKQILLRIKSRTHERGFTLLDVLVTISIISLLASQLMVSYVEASRNARNTNRKRNMRTVAQALELYYNDNGKYPTTGGRWQGACMGGWPDAKGEDPNDPTSDAWIPNLTPKYMTRLPHDSLTKKPNRWSTFYGCYNNPDQNCYQYRSNGKDYKLIAYCTPEEPKGWKINDPFYDPGEPGYTKDWAIFTPGAKSWN